MKYFASIIIIALMSSAVGQNGDVTAEQRLHALLGRLIVTTETQADQIVQLQKMLLEERARIEQCSKENTK